MRKHDVVIVGAGAAGAAVAASLLKRSPTLDVVVVDPADTHWYQPGWTMVGAGVFDVARTGRPMDSVLHRRAKRIKATVHSIDAMRSRVVLDRGEVVSYSQLVVCPGLQLDWASIEGLPETLGKNGVTSNYRRGLATYTWELVQGMRKGRAVFTQPAMPIKCAGAPQKAMYLAADYWRNQAALTRIDVDFCTAGSTLFGVADYVPALMDYVRAYGIQLDFGHTLVAVDGNARRATFKVAQPGGQSKLVTGEFDMLHVVPPQSAPGFIRESGLSDSAGWMDVDPATLRHKAYPNVFGLGDVTNTSNAKTAAAVRKQAPVVAHNLLVARGQAKNEAAYDGYGSCPLTVENGKIVLAEFLYGGKVAPTFPTWLIEGTQPSRLAWHLKERLLPAVYWNAMLKGREWLAAPRLRQAL